MGYKEEKKADWTAKINQKIRFKKNKTIKFEFDAIIRNMDENGVGDFVVIRVNEDEEKVLSVKRMDNTEKEAKNIVKSLYYFNCLFAFRKEGHLLGVGRFMGENLQDWFAQHTSRSLWMILGNEIVVANSSLSLLLKRISHAFLKHHLNGKALGFSMSKLYINGSNFTLCDNSQVVSNAVEGIQNDLMQFQKFILHIASNNKNDTSILLFDALFPKVYPTDIDELMVRSYLICHSPLFWSKEQRLLFAIIYNSIRDHYTGVDMEMKCDSGLYNLKGWWKSLAKPPGFHPLEVAYRHDGMKQPYLLVQYIRNVLNHQVDSVSVPLLDEELLIRFPFAFSKTYGQLVENALNNPNFPFNGGKLVDLLKCDGLDYRKGSLFCK